MFEEEKRRKLKCVICDRESGSANYCRLHAKAYENIIGTYKEWKRALDISWKEYLSEIVNNPLTGELAKEIARHLINTGEQIDVQES